MDRGGGGGGGMRKKEKGIKCGKGFDRGFLVRH